MKFFSPLLLTLSLLSACQPPTQLPPQPGFDTPNPATSCNPTSVDVSFSVYSNANDRDFYYPGVEADKNIALHNPVLEINGQTRGTVNTNAVRLPRPEGKIELRVSAPGHVSAEAQFDLAAFPNTLCENNYVALSPLSVEERQGEMLPAEVFTLNHTLKLHSEPGSGLEYGVIDSLAQLEAVAPRLRSGMNQDPLESATLDKLRDGLRAGQRLVLVSNGSQGMGDLFQIVQRVTRRDQEVILASHLGVIHADPPPAYPYGDRFSPQIEAVLVPGDTQTLVLDLLKAGAGGGDKQRLEVPMADALLPQQAAQPTPPPTPEPGGSPSTECNGNSATVQFAVYANPRDQDFSYYSVPFDKSQPLSTAQLSLNGVSGSVDGNLLSAPRPDSAPEVRITAPGYAPLVAPYLSNSQLCQNNVVALSPLSAEEQAGSEVPLQKISFAEGVSLKRHAESGLEYAVIDSTEAFEALAPRFRSAWSQAPLPETTLAPLRDGLAAGYKLALVSNGSQGLGDLFALVHRVTDAGSTTILASHLNNLMQEPSPPRPIGDRFSRQIEAVLIPGDTDTLVLDLLQAGAGGGRKQRLEIAVADALI